MVLGDYPFILMICLIMGNHRNPFDGVTLAPLVCGPAWLSCLPCLGLQSLASLLSGRAHWRRRDELDLYFWFPFFSGGFLKRRCMGYKAEERYAQGARRKCSCQSIQCTHTCD